MTVNTDPSFSLTNPHNRYVSWRQGREDIIEGASCCPGINVVLQRINFPLSFLDSIQRLQMLSTLANQAHRHVYPGSQFSLNLRVLKFIVLTTGLHWIHQSLLENQRFSKVKNRDTNRVLELKFKIYHLLIMWPLGNYLTSLCLGCLVYKIGIVIVGL